MDLLQMGAQILTQQLGGNANTSSSSLQNILGSLIGDGDSLNIGSLMEKMQGGGGGLAEIAQSWLGDGDNAAISASQLRDVIDTDQLNKSAAELGTDQDSLMDMLTQAIPQMVDSGSQGGSLLDSLGGLDGVANLAKGFFGK
jgi:uncharacterized protein YidB (DUF937 family)